MRQGDTATIARVDLLADIICSARATHQPELPDNPMDDGTFFLAHAVTKGWVDHDEADMAYEISKERYRSRYDSKTEVPDDG